MFDAFFNAIAGLLAWFYELPIVGGSYGGAIVLLTLTVMIIVTPLTLKGTRSMMAMQALAPEMKRIQAEYAHDRAKMNEVLLEFYKDNQINPVGGCLPMLLQAPVFIILYRVISGLTQTGAGGGFDPKYISSSSDLFQSLQGQTEMRSWGIDLASSASSMLSDNFITGLPYILLIIAVAATSFIQQKQISGRNPNAEIPQQQKILLRVMPVFFAFISFRFAAALVVYFLVSNLYRIGQQAYISKKIYGADGTVMTKGAIETTATEKSAKGIAEPKKSESTSKPAPKKTSGSGKSAKSAPTGGKGAKNSSPPKKTHTQSRRVTPSKRQAGESATRGVQQPRKKKRS
ncbi:MAG: membrane protein insertase YidC [Acidimicrobiia bacterium]